MTRLSIEQLRTQVAPIQAEIYRLETQERSQKNKALIGRCFKYHNSYSGDDRWWLYAIVTRSDEHWPRGLQFQHTSRGEFIVTHDELLTGLENGGWVPIKKGEFLREWKKFKQLISRMNLDK